jgi:hypothetical protein
MIEGIAKDGSKFNADSTLVIKFMEKYPDVTLEAAIGSVVEQYEQEQAEDLEKAIEEGIIE